MSQRNRMKWFGFALNIIALIAPLLYLKYQSGSNAFYHYLYDFLSVMLVPILLSLLSQSFSFIFLSRLPKVGLTFAILGSVLMLPISIIFLVGYLFSYEQIRNKGLALFPHPKTGRSYKGTLRYRASYFTLRGVLFLLVGALLLTIAPPVAGIIMGTAVLLLAISSRLEGTIMLAINNNNLIITPSLFSASYLVPLPNIYLAGETNNAFKLSIKVDNYQRTITFVKSMIEQEGQQKKLAQLFSVIGKA